MSASDLTAALAAVEAIQDADPDQWVTWAQIVREKAPDLCAMLGVPDAS